MELPIGPCKVRALYSWPGETPKDLGFVEGDIIDVLDTGGGDWWTGKLKRNNLVGTFPRNYVMFLDRNQKTQTVVESLSISQSELGNSQSSARSAKEFLDDLAVQFSEYEAPKLSKTEKLAKKYPEFDILEKSEKPPQPPPHKTQKQKRNPMKQSPAIEETPFDPVAFAPKVAPKARSVSGVSTRSKSFTFGSTKPLKSESKQPNESDVNVTSLSSLKNHQSTSKLATFLKPLRLLSKKNETEPLALKSSSEIVHTDWMTSQRNLYRAKTLTQREREHKRQLLELQGLPSVDPVECVRCSIRDKNPHDYRLENHEAVDAAILGMTTWPQLMTPAVLASSRICRVYSDIVSQLRAVFMLCASHIHYEDVKDVSVAQKEQILSRVMHTKRANPFALALMVQDMCSALNVGCRVIKGHVRAPETQITGVPHAWNLVEIEGRELFLDACAASPSFPYAQGSEVCGFFFLTPPEELIYTHIPCDSKDTLLTPGLPQSVARALPVASPACFTYNAKFVDYFAGLTVIKDFELCELTLLFQDPAMDIYAEVYLPDGSTCTALAQPYWNEGKRNFRVKAFLPPGTSRGRLQIFASERKALKESSARYPLYTLPLHHRGQSSEYAFVERKPTPRALRQDLYIVNPQCRTLKGGESYTFKVEQHPSRGISVGSGLVPVRMGIQSPSGRVTKLIQHGTELHDTWKIELRTLEVGVWRGLVGSDSDDGWVVFAEWMCM